MEKFLIKLNRFSAWVLLVLIVLFIVSGYGMTKQIIDPVFATQLHNSILPIPLFIFFLLHVGLSIRYSLRRWNLFQDKKTADIYILIISLILLVFFLWLFLR